MTIQMLIHQAKVDLAATLCDKIVESSLTALDGGSGTDDTTLSTSTFTLALSGGSIPKLLSMENMCAAFRRRGVEPSFANWHVFLADER